MIAGFFDRVFRRAPIVLALRGGIASDADMGEAIRRLRPDPVNPGRVLGARLIRRDDGSVFCAVERRHVFPGVEA